MDTKNLFTPQTSDLLENLALIVLDNFHHDHILLKLKIKKLSPKINVKNIKTRVYKLILLWHTVNTGLAPVNRSMHCKLCTVNYAF